MNKLKFSVILIIVSLMIPLMGWSLSDKSDVPGVSASTNKKSYSPGESGVLTIKFKTGAKIKIPKEPGVTVNLTSGDIEGQGMQDYTGGDGDYISSSQVKYNFVVPAGASSGSTLNISGNVKFAYCSTVDGVCKIATKNFSAKIKVK